MVGIFPNRDAAIRLIGAVLAPLVSRRYISLETLELVHDHTLPQPDPPATNPSRSPRDIT